MYRKLTYFILCLALGFALTGCASQTTYYAYIPSAAQSLDAEYHIQLDFLEKSLSIINVMDAVKNANDIAIIYSHSTLVDDIDYEIDWVGASYDYVEKQGLITSIHPDYTAEVRYDEYDSIVLVDTVPSTDWDLRDNEVSYLTSSLNTIGLVTQVLYSSSTCKTVEFNYGTSYVTTTNSSVLKEALVHEVSDDEIDRIELRLYIPKSSTDMYTADIRIYSNDNDKNIDCERYHYEWTVNTGYKSERPQFYEENIYERNDETDAYGANG